MKKPTSRYIELVEIFQPRPIRNERTLKQTRKVIDSLIDREDLSADEMDYLSILGTLVEVYENEHEPEVPRLSDRDMLTHLIESHNVTQRAVAEATGIPESTISDLLAGRRDFNKGHIQKLSAYFKISPGVFFSTRGMEKPS